MKRKKTQFVESAERRISELRGKADILCRRKLDLDLEIQSNLSCITELSNLLKSLNPDCSQGEAPLEDLEEQPGARQPLNFVHLGY
jgi:predicted  nucleic acid-binding Zn-ribbon protein